MTHTSTNLPRGDGDARTHDQIAPSLLPYRTGRPPQSLWSPAGSPPDGFDFRGAVATTRCWMAPCPCCCSGWVALVPDGSRYGYAIETAAGCSCGCSGPEIAWWHLWRLGCLPPREPATVTGRTRAYAKAVIRRQLADLPNRPTADQLRGVAFQLGRWLEAADLPADLVAPALLAAGERAGLARADLAAPLAAAVTAGRSDPARAPA